jgi:hypothetical protein
MGIGELLVNRHTIVPHDALDDNATPSELHFSEQAENIHSVGIDARAISTTSLSTLSRIRAKGTANLRFGY